MLNKRGRKPKPDGEVRKRQMNVALTEYEKEAFDELAMSRGRTVSEMARGLMHREYKEDLRKNLLCHRYVMQLRERSHLEAV